MSELDGRPILCFSNIEWGIWKQRHHHLMERFAQANRVLFIETLGMRSPNLLSPHDLRRIGGRLSRVAREALSPRGATTGKDRDLPDNLSVYSPLVVPFHGSSAVRRVNTRLVLRDLRHRLRAEGLTDPILWVYLPTDLVLEVAAGLNHRLLVYDCVDEITAFRDAPAGLVDSERRIIDAADVIFASSRCLQEKCRVRNPRVHYVPNAGEVDRFARDSRGPEPADIAGLPRPRVGYVGAIREWFDLELLEAAAGRFPDASFVLIGDDASELAPLRARFPNIHVLGSRPYELLPAYLGALDVCLIPFRDTELIRNTHPIKVYEYLAAGRPVIATPMREIEHMQEVDLAAHGEPFLQALGRRLQESPDPEGNRRRRDSVAAETWDARFRIIETVLEESLAGPRPAAAGG